MKKVKDIDPSKIKSPSELVDALYAGGGFSAKNIGIGMDILEKMIKDKDCKKFLSFPACIVATGTRGVLKEIVKRKLVDVIITTCGTLDHDIARSLGEYEHGNFFADDAKLHKRKILRLGNIFIPSAKYGPAIEKFMQPILSKLYNSGKRELSTKELSWEIGKALDKNSILYWAYKNKIPVYVPGITDGAVGSQLWMFGQDHNFKIDLLKDEQELADIVFTAKRTGALMIGGGISKHHTIWWAQFKSGLDYAVYITTAPEYDGSLSGARLREAVSWGKVKEKARYVTIEGDATLILPLIISALLERVKSLR